MKLKLVMRLDPIAQLFRVGRLLWEHGTVGDGIGYSNKLSLALSPRLFRWEPQHNGWIVTVLGVRIIRRRSYGGRFV